MGIISRIITSFKREREKQILEAKIQRRIRKECKWKYIGKGLDPRRAPRWLKKAFYKNGWRHGATYYFKTKRYVYKIVAGFPEFQGQNKLRWYKRKRRGPVARKVISEEKRRKKA